MKARIVDAITAKNGKKGVIVKCERGFFALTHWPDGSYTRTASEGMTLESRDIDYAAIGAKTHSSIARAASEFLTKNS